MSDELSHGDHVVVCFNATVFDPVPDVYGQIKVRNHTDNDCHYVNAKDVSLVQD